MDRRDKNDFLSDDFATSKPQRRTVGSSQNRRETEFSSRPKQTLDDRELLNNSKPVQRTPKINERQRPPQGQRPPLQAQQKQRADLPHMQTASAQRPQQRDSYRQSSQRERSYTEDSYRDDYAKHPNSSRDSRQPKKARRWTVGKIFLIDFLILCVALTVFIYFHLINPSLPPATSGTILPGSISTAQTSPEPTPAIPTQNPGVAEDSTEPVPEPTVVDDGTWRSKWPDKFGELEVTDSSYKSENINVTYTQHVVEIDGDQITYQVADIYITELKYLISPLASGEEFERGVYVPIADLTQEHNTIVAISDDYAGDRKSGVVVRDGVLYREEPFEDVCVIFNDGTMVTYPEDEFSTDIIKQNGAWQAWAFGPLLLTDGQPMDSFNSNVNPRNPRTMIGYYEPGHYVFVTVDGRQSHSDGMSTKEMSQLMYELGCTTAYNLDGGETSQMAWGNEVVGSPYNGGRDMTGIIGIAEVD